jgi:hypothetical protein
MAAQHAHGLTARRHHYFSLPQDNEAKEPAELQQITSRDLIQRGSQPLNVLALF